MKAFDLITHYDQIGEDVYNCHVVAGLVRCKDCKFYRPNKQECHSWENLKTHENGYCHRAERREG